jgi:hypothetical protein
MLRTFISGSPNWSRKAKYRDDAGCATPLALLNPGQHPLAYFVDRAKVTFRYLRGIRSLRIIFRVVAHERRQPDRALYSPFPEPVFGYLLGQFLVGDGSPE